MAGVKKQSSPSLCEVHSTRWRTQAQLLAEASAVFTQAAPKLPLIQISGNDKVAESEITKLATLVEQSVLGVSPLYGDPQAAFLRLPVLRVIFLLLHRIWRLAALAESNVARVFGKS